MSIKLLSTPLLISLLALLGMPVFAQESAPVAPLDELRLTNGSIILGQVTGARDGSISIDTEFAGTLSIAFDNVASLDTNNPMVLQLADGTVLRDRLVQVQEEKVIILTETGESMSYETDQLSILNPEPWELGEKMKWSGKVSFAMVVERGNSDTDELDFNAESVWMDIDDRYTLKAFGEIDEANDIKSADNWTVLGKYDHFWNDYNYWGLNVYTESDEFADLDLRYYIGPYVGREFFHESIFTLGAEVGLSYVNEDFSTAEDQDYPGANWNVRMSSNYLGGDSKLYFDQLGIWNLDETSDIIINTKVGLSFPLLWSLEAAVEILLDYDSGAVEGVEELDQTYSFRVGYTW